MDMSYATIPLFGEHTRLYRENRLAYVVSSLDNPNNHSVYDVDIDLGYPIFFNDSHIEQDFPVVNELNEDKKVAKRK